MVVVLYPINSPLRSFLVIHENYHLQVAKKLLFTVSYRVIVVDSSLAARALIIYSVHRVLTFFPSVSVRRL